MDSIGPRSFDRFLSRYRDLLGFELVRRRVLTGVFIETVVGFQGAELHIVAALWIPQAPEPPSQHHLELIEYVTPKGFYQAR